MASHTVTLVQLCPSLLQETHPHFAVYFRACKARVIQICVTWNIVINDNFLWDSIHVEIKCINASLVDWGSFEKGLNQCRVSFSQHLDSRPQVAICKSASLQVVDFQFTVVEEWQIVFENIGCSVPFNSVEVSDRLLVQTTIFVALVEQGARRSREGSVFEGVTFGNNLLDV